MPLPSKSKAKKRPRDFTTSQILLRNFSPTTEAEEAARDKAIADLELLKKQNEETVKKIEEAEQLVEEQTELAEKIKRAEKAKKNRLKGDPAADVSALDKEIAEDKETMNKNKDRLDAIEKEVEANDAKNSLGEMATLDTKQRCEKLAPELSVEKLSVCPAGQHDEEIIYPTVPESEAKVADRIAKSAEVADDKGSTFEARAAEKNNKDGHLSEGKQISRKLTPEEIARGDKGTAQAVQARCSKCGRLREIDHMAEMDKKPTIVECKNKKSLSKDDKNKILDNAMLAKKMGGKTCYKFPESQASAAREASVKDKYDNGGKGGDPDAIVILPIPGAEADVED